MASMRDIKRRRDSIQSTGQITKAMKLVSTVKLQKAKGKAESTKPYFDLMYDTVKNMLAKSGNINHKYLKAGDSSKKAIITITANRGLAGGYNSNITRLITGSDIPKEDALIYAIGTKEISSLCSYCIYKCVFLRNITTCYKSGNIRIISSGKSSVRCNCDNRFLTRISGFQIFVINIT